MDGCPCLVVTCSSALQDKSPHRIRSSANTLAQSLRWVREQLTPLDIPALLWGLLAATVVLRVFQALWGPHSAQSPPPAHEEKPQLFPKKDSGSASKQAAPAPESGSVRNRVSRKKK